MLEAPHAVVWISFVVAENENANTDWFNSIENVVRETLQVDSSPITD